VGSIALCLLLTYPLLRLAGRRPWSRSLTANVLTRTVLSAALCICIYAVLPGWEVLWSTGIALAVGIDASLTCMDLGWQARPLIWYRNFLRSGFHLGIVGALIATVVVPGGTRLAVEVPLYVCMHVWLAAALTTVWLAGYIHSGEQLERQLAISDVIAGERRDRAHWLHDDVCAQLRLVSLKVQTDASSTDEIVQLLDEFDHQLRLRQLDELFGSGSIRVAELLQPYIRNAQNHGVTIEQVPDFDEAAALLSENEARLFARAVNVLTSNALNVGATSIAYNVRNTAEYLHLSVSDNGPGFSLSQVPHGRGLWGLINDLRPGGIEITTSASGGATVIASVPHRKRSERGQHLARR
jgi:signal transduction histidine kinase